MLGANLGLTGLRQGGAWWPANACFMADFIGNRYMSGGSPIAAADAFSFSRTTSKLAAGSNGLWTSFGPNVPALTDRGLSIEPAATNLLPNAALAGGTPATYNAIGNAGLPPGLFIRNIPGGVSADISYATESGLPCMDIRLYGTATNNTPFVLTFSPNNAVAATVGQRVLTSVFLSKRAGTIPSSVTLRAYEYDAGGNNTSTLDLLALDVANGPLSRFSREYVVANSTTTACLPALRIGAGTGVSIDATIRLAVPQCELSPLANPGSPVMTFGSSVTRSPDGLTLNLPGGTASLRMGFENGTAYTTAASPGPFAVLTTLAYETITTISALTS